MRQKANFNIMMAICTLGVSVLACLSTSLKPSHYGVFFEQDGELIELREQEIFEIPVEQQMENVQTINNPQPNIVIWRSNTNLDYLEFLKLNQYLGATKNNVSYNATPKDDGIIEIIPNVPLEDGIYCLIQGDPLAVLPSGWCFRIRNGPTSSTPVQSGATETSNIPTAIPNSSLDQDATLFRDQVLQILKQIDTVRYTFVKTEATDPTSPPVRREGVATQTSAHETQYTANGEVFSEIIAVDSTLCVRSGGPWSCYLEPPTDNSLFGISNILMGENYQAQSNEKVIGFGSSLESYNETLCRAFFVQVQAPVSGTENDIIIELTRVCFDLESHYLVFMSIDDSHWRDGSLINKNSYVTSELKFNVPVDEIVLPQQ